MSKLVFIKNERVVTDSLTIAESFKKEHGRILRDVRELECSEEFRVGNFAESTYRNSLDREYPIFTMTEQAFTLLVMGYTGKNAMRFKEMYIGEFHAMREQLQQNIAPLNEKQSLIALMKLSAMTAEETEDLKQTTLEHSEKLKEIECKVENQITLDYGEQRGLQKAVARRVYKLCGIAEERPGYFAEIHREIKDRFGVSSYKDVKRQELLSAIQYVDHWIPRRAVS